MDKDCRGFGEDSVDFDLPPELAAYLTEADRRREHIAGYMFGFMDQRAPKGVTE